VLACLDEPLGRANACLFISSLLDLTSRQPNELPDTERERKDREKACGPLQAPHSYTGDTLKRSTVRTFSIAERNIFAAGSALARRSKVRSRG
jgi:hypothetical protein